ncbi:MAG: substrate-binding domain-containing protein [Micrococcales bacterium]|nr:substrate-binding domain-containing protein [Micrococcales bacterium]
MRKVIAAAAAVALSITLAACSSGTPSGTTTGAGGSTPAASKPLVYLVSKGFSQTFWQAVNQGAQQEADQQGLELKFVGPNDESSIAQQTQQLQAALAANPAVIGFASLDDGTASASVLSQIQAANIPVIAFDSGVPASTIPVTTVATDNAAAAAEGVKQLCGMIPNDPSTKVGILLHDYTSASGMDRFKGFVQGIQANCPNVTVVGAGQAKPASQLTADDGKTVTVTNSDTSKANSIASGYIAANPDLTALWASNQGSAEGALNVPEVKSGKVKLVGFDSGALQKAAITSGEQAGAITQDPQSIGSGTVAVAAALITNKPVQWNNTTIDPANLPKTIATNFYWYDKTNITSAQIAPCLYD